MTKIALFAALGTSLLLGACVLESGNQPDPTRQPWRDSWKALSAAKAGDPEGLKNCFAAARAQLMLPYVNGGEDAEAILENMIAILEWVGDKQFEEALLREDPKTRSAVREFLIEDDTRENHPRAHKILVDAPSVKWSSDLAQKESYIQSADIPPTKREVKS